MLAECQLYFSLFHQALCSLPPSLPPSFHPFLSRSRSLDVLIAMHGYLNTVTPKKVEGDPNLFPAPFQIYTQSRPGWPVDIPTIKSKIVARMVTPPWPRQHKPHMRPFITPKLLKVMCVIFGDFSAVSVTTSGRILDCSTLSHEKPYGFLTLHPSLPVNYGGLSAQTWIPRPLSLLVYL